jgi:hypothetical protein
MVTRGPGSLFISGDASGGFVAAYVTSSPGRGALTI